MYVQDIFQHCHFQQPLSQQLEHWDGARESLITKIEAIQNKANQYFLCLQLARRAHATLFCLPRRGRRNTRLP